MSRIETILKKFEPVSLDKIGKVKLMDRVDRKYWFHLSRLEELLKRSLEHYNVLEINNQRLMEYQTTYLDTPDDKMYLTHHNQKLNRYKVRKRKYVSSDIGFFEIKFKTNKKRTVKERIKTDFESANVQKSETGFLVGNSPFDGVDLQPSLRNKFYRITLIHKEQKDRCTLDLQPKFWNGDGEIEFEDLVIVELKRGRSQDFSPMLAILRELKIRQRGLSKYCTGRAMLDPNLKQNAFKPRLRYLKKNVLTKAKEN